MLKYISIIFLLITFSTLNLQGQNLIPNGNFEKTNRKATNKIEPSAKGFNQFFPQWRTTKCTPDVWIENNKARRKWGIDTTLVKGKGTFVALGFMLASYSEHIYTPLKKPIEKGKIYKFDINIGMGVYNAWHGGLLLKTPLSEPALLDATFGVAFSNDTIHYKNFLSREPHIHFDNYEVIPGLWTKVTGYFKSDKDYSHLTIGQFWQGTNGAAPADGQNNVAYLFIDDISLIEVDSIPKEKPKDIASPVVKITKDTFTINDILFKTGSADISSSANQELDILIKKIQSKSIQKVEIIGHTDNVGSDDLNKRLSESRAKSVFDYLGKNGINADKMAFKGAGSSFPITSNSTKIGRAKNRRVEIVVSSTSEKVTYTTPQHTQQSREPYLFSKDITESPTQSWDYTDITNYEKAVLTHGSRSAQTMPSDMIPFEKHQPVSAKNYILAQTQKSQITLINEAHHYPKNRAFITELLPYLYQQGYRYIGFEALFAADSLINQRKYPVLTSGDMTKEPLMGDLVRRAIELGFTVFGYDIMGSELENKIAENKKKQQPVKDEGLYLADEDFILNMNTRDRVQAENIAHFIKNKPKSKVLIIAGFGHIKELSSDFWSPMAFQLQKLTGINPLTIDQTKMIECAERSDESIFLKKAVENGIKEPSVFLKNGTPFIAKEFNPNFPEEYVKFYDIQVFHPRTNWSRPRPTWMTMNGYRVPFKVKKSLKITFPCLIMAFKIGEDIKTAVPMDVIECTDTATDYFLMLPRGKYLLIYKDENYEVIHKEMIEVN
jgi:outer membrane protein OmpA-like peptidoglycan-associated protein